MSKKREEEFTTGWGEGYVISRWTVPNLQGKLLTFIESIGLRDTQEKAVKDIISQIIWDTMDEAQYVTGEQHTALRNENSRMGQPNPLSLPNQ